MDKIPTRTVVFDLDDTLYYEADYVRSGKIAVADIIQKTFGVDLTDQLIACEGDFLALACRTLALPRVSKESLLWLYRLHCPVLSLRPGAQDLLCALRALGNAICIITDGRAVTQRLKIAALNIAYDQAYISEEVGVEKPDPLAFRRVEQDWPADSYVYVGDNARKDFIAPRQLGWTSFGLMPHPRSIHPCLPDQIAPNHAPDFWVEDFTELASMLMLDNNMLTKNNKLQL